jgi:uncharacterized protein DUF6611
MQDQMTDHGLMRRAIARLLDGAAPWGSATVTVDRFGGTRYRLTVYPPGTGESERRWLRAWRGWPLWGAMLWVVSEILLSGVVGPWTALVVGVTACVVSGVVTSVLAGAARTHVRTIGAMVLAGYRDPESMAARGKIQRLASVLSEADDRRRAGALSPIDYEQLWWQVYDQMAPVTAEMCGPDRSPR